MTVATLKQGVVIGLLMKFVEGKAFVIFPGNLSETAIEARSLAALGPEDLGCEVALLFEDGDVTRPLIVGRIVEPARAERPASVTPASVTYDGKTLSIQAAERIELRVGEASLVMDKTGQITIRGKHVVSHASVANRIRGGSVSLN